MTIETRIIYKMGTLKGGIPSIRKQYYYISPIHYTSIHEDIVNILKDHRLRLAAAHFMDLIDNDGYILKDKTRIEYVYDILDISLKKLNDRDLI
jgi:hypothetical protein